jgi:cytochrome b involved in lipid metabolism
MKKIFYSIMVIAALIEMAFLVSPRAQPTKPKTKTNSISLNDISKHNTASDCWMVIEGNVYDVTSYIALGDHPGGTTMINGCGKEATLLFTNKPHSQKATNMLPPYQIGIISN